MKKKNKRAMVAYYSGILFNTFRNIDMARFIPLDNKLQKLVVGIDPVQDLHGYDKPWPDGGGANIWDEEWEVGGINTTTGQDNTLTDRIRSKNYIPVTPNTEYRYVNGTNNLVVLYYDIDKNYLDEYYYMNVNQDLKTTSANCYYIRFYMVGAYGTTYNNDIAINYPATVTTYSPYSNICPISGHNSVNVIVSTSTNPLDGTITNIPLGQTVYGGTLDVLTGLLTIDRALVTFNGSETWYDYPSFEGFFTALSSMSVGTRQDGISNMLIDSKTTASGQKNSMWLGVGSRYFFALGVYESMGNTLEDFKTFLSLNNLQVVYPLDTPQTVQLTPQQINTIVGSWNYVWCDSGKIIELEA